MIQFSVAIILLIELNLFTSLSFLLYSLLISAATTVQLCSFELQYFLRIFGIG